MNDNISNNIMSNSNINNNIKSSDNISDNNNMNNNNINNNNNNNINKNVKSSDTNTDVSNQIFIMGHNIAKHVRGYEQSRKVENYKVYVKSFTGEKVMRIEDYVKPTLREMPTHIILHFGTNDVPTKKVPEQIAENIANLAIKLKRNCNVSTSSITARNDQ